MTVPNVKNLLLKNASMMATVLAQKDSVQQKYHPFFLIWKDLVKAGLGTKMYFKILEKLVQYVLVYYQLTMKFIRAFADSMQACIVLYIIYQSSPVTNRSVIGMLSSIA